MKYFLIAGEPSGDILGAKLIRALKEKDPDAVITGIGGPFMEKAGMDVHLEMDELTIMGIWEVVMRLPQLLKLISGVVDDIERENPDVVITIDFPDFNFQVLQRVKKRGKVKPRLIHYVAPSVWAWREKRAKHMAKFLDAILCLFPFEPAFFQKQGLKALYSGHPITQEDAQAGDGAGFRAENNIPEDATVVGIFFGSRENEIKKISPVFDEIIEYLGEKYPNLHVIAPTLKSVEYDIYRALEGRDIPSFVITDPNKKWDAFQACDAAAAVSGTVALELAYAGIPHIVLYKTHPLTYILARLLAKVKFIHLGNILLERAVVPELIQGQCKSELAVYEMIQLLEKPELAEEQRRYFAKIRKMLGGNLHEAPSQKIARFIVSAARRTSIKGKVKKTKRDVAKAKAERQSIQKS